ncbi:MAG: hypothetical protein LBS98_07475 [Coriobacteriales bacterium]|jgi:hypothetical protein|nr:hypothetical protein [Coriobacteriales bacterium]
MAKKKDINLYKVATGRVRTKSRRPLVISTILIVLAGALIAFGVYYCTSTITRLALERDDLNQYLESNLTLEQYNNSFEAQNEAEAMEGFTTQIKGTLLNISSYPEITGTDYQLIMGSAGSNITITGLRYERRTGILSFRAACSDTALVPHFIERLRTQGNFADVQYRGYVQSDTGESTLYTYELECLVKKPTPTLPSIAEAASEKGGA